MVDWQDIINSAQYKSAIGQFPTKMAQWPLKTGIDQPFLPTSYFYYNLFVSCIF